MHTFQSHWHRPAVLVALLMLVALTASAAPTIPVVETSVMIPMRDGIHLATTLFRPSAAGQWPVVLIRTPYDKSRTTADNWFVQWGASLDYAVAVQDMRGRFASEGTDSTFWTDGWGVNQDGYDTIEWIGNASWCDGNVGMVGSSARGIAQVLAVGAAPPSLKACVISIACDDFYNQAMFQGGAFRKKLVEGWMGSQGSSYMVPFFTAHPLHDEFWDYLDLNTRADQVNVPCIHLGGHYDVFGKGAIDAFHALQDSGGVGARGKQRLVLGPWQHRGDGIDGTEQGQLTYPANSIYDYTELTWEWFDHWMKGIENGVENGPAVSYYLMGDVDDPFAAGNIWIETDEWPPPGEPRPYYFFPDGKLKTDPAELSHIGQLTYTYDPMDPIPTLGGRNLNIDAGPYDQRPLNNRPDQLIFTSEPLTSRIAVVGKVTAVLHASSSAVDTDWTVKLIDVYPDGREMLVTDGIFRARYRDGFDHAVLMEPGEVYEFTVDLWSTALVYDYGHRIQVVVSSSNYPRFDANPNTGGELSPPIVAQNTIHLTSEEPSYIVLPIQNGGSTVSVPALAAPSPVRVLGLRNPSADCRFVLELDRPGVLEAGVFSTSGNLVEWLHRGMLSRGSHALSWDGVSTGGRRVGSGVYYLRITRNGDEVARRTLVLVR